MPRKNKQMDRHPKRERDGHRFSELLSGSDIGFTAGFWVFFQQVCRRRPIGSRRELYQGETVPRWIEPVGW
jgi:hypothetical protein